MRNKRRFATQGQKCRKLRKKQRCSNCKLWTLIIKFNLSRELSICWKVKWSITISLVQNNINHSMKKNWTHVKNCWIWPWKQTKDVFQTLTLNMIIKILKKSLLSVTCLSEIRRFILNQRAFKITHFKIKMLTCNWYIMKQVS